MINWKVRVHIYTILVLPVEILESIVEFLIKYYRKFFVWLLWDLASGLFSSKYEFKSKSEINERDKG